MARTAPLVLVIAGLAAGCFESHGRAGPPDASADAPSPHDASDRDACVASEPGVFAWLECPASIAPGEPVVVTVGVEVPGCCPASALEAAMGTSSGSPAGDVRFVDVRASWRSCECCADCECAPAPFERTVALDARGARRVEITAGEHRCTVAVELPDCREVRADEWIAPDAVRVGDSLPVLMRSLRGVSCGCTPRGELTVPEGPDASLLACGCSDEDPCVDPGYDATVVASPSSSPGQRQLYHPYPGGRVVIEVVDPAACSGGALTVDALELVSPDDSLVHDEPPHRWLRVTGTQRRCCGEPLVAIPHAAATPGPDGRSSIALAPLECAPDPCDCGIGIERAFETFHDLGALPPGVYDVDAGTARLTFAAR